MKAYRNGNGGIVFGRGAPRLKKNHLAHLFYRIIMSPNMPVALLCMKEIMLLHEFVYNCYTGATRLANSSKLHSYSSTVPFYSHICYVQVCQACTPALQLSLRGCKEPKVVNKRPSGAIYRHNGKTRVGFNLEFNVFYLYLVLI